MPNYEEVEAEGILADGLDLKIQQLRDAVVDMKNTLADLTLQQLGLPEGERSKLDSEIGRYEDSIIINERKIEQLTEALMDRVDTESPVN